MRGVRVKRNAWPYHVRHHRQIIARTVNTRFSPPPPPREPGYEANPVAITALKICRIKKIIIIIIIILMTNKGQEAQ